MTLGNNNQMIGFPMRPLFIFNRLLTTLTATTLLYISSVDATDYPKPTTTTKPNIVIIYADDMGYGDLGIQNPEAKLQTPHLDQLAREGMRFTDHYAGSTVCAPSRCCLMTGLHSGHAWVRGNARVPLRPSDVTVA